MMQDESESEKEVRVTKDDKVSVYKESHVKRTQDADVHVMTDDEENLNVKARRAGSALEDLVTSAIDKAKATTKQKTEEVARRIDAGPGAVSATKDAHEISRLGPRVEDLARAFEDTMTDIRKHDYEEQEKLLIGYRKLLQEQINVINSMRHFAKRVK
jgi:hypothetical protein